MQESESIFADDQITFWLNRLQSDDPQAAQALWNRFSTQLAAIAKNRFGGISRQVYDEEDAALSAFRSFCRGVSEERFPDLNSRDNLWCLLVTITARKVGARRRYEQRDRRGGGEVKVLPLQNSRDADGKHLIDVLASAEPGPEFAVELSEQCERLFSQLEDDLMKQIVLLRIEGFNNTEIAERLGCTRNRVTRRLTRARGLWESQLENDDDSAN